MAWNASFAPRESEKFLGNGEATCFCLELVFEKSGDVDLSLNLSGSHVHAEMAKRLISEEINGNRVTFYGF
jgi:hypothetical protein